ncbi:MAG: retroviral-like aspartic protease family protein [Methanobacteriota archaeon]
MGIFRVRVKVFNLEQRTREEEVVMVVDSGATYAVVPRRTAEELGIQPSEQRTFTLANGTRTDRSLGWAGLAYDGRASPCLVVLGEEGDVALLGAVALETLGYEVDPVAQALRPATQYML